MSIVHNLPALIAANSFQRTNKSLAKSLRSLSTGLRINSSADDAAGFAITQKLRSQISGFNVASRNTQDAISLLKTADDALANTNSLLQRMRALAVQAANDTLTSQDRTYLQMEIDDIQAQIDNISHNTTFNNKHLLDDSCGASWSSDNLNVRARINSTLGNAQGSYRLEISSEPGLPQIQSSNIMLISQDNVLMDKSVAYSDAVCELKADNLPDGEFMISSAQANNARVIASGVYGLDFQKLDTALTPSVRNSTLNANASILFQVKNVDNDSITLQASANILLPDGSLDNKFLDNITLHNGELVDLSSSLGLGLQGNDTSRPDGAFELLLNDASAFKAGDKFVYNLNTSNNSDITLNVNAGNYEHSINDNSNQAIIMKSNTFKPVEPLPSAAKVLFLIDNSGSMGPSFQTVKNSISSFLDSIRSQGVDDIKIGVARYLTNGITNSSFDWFDDENDLIDALAINLVGGSVDPYKAITDAVDNYDMSDVLARHIVLITDTGQEVKNGGTLASAKSALSASGITLSAVSNGSSAITNLITQKGMDLRISDNQWGNKLVNDLGKKIGTDAINSAINTTPLSEYKQFSNIFPDNSSESRYITISNNDGSYTLEISPDDTLNSIAQKLSAISGVNAEINYSDDLDDGERGLSISLTVQYTSDLVVSGDNELVSIMGLRSNYDLAYGLNSDAISGKEIHMRNYYLDSLTGKVHEGDIIISGGLESINNFGPLAKFKASSIGKIPSSDVKLIDVNNFSGVKFPQSLRITQGDGKSATLTLTSADTIGSMCEKVNAAISEDLGQGKYVMEKKFASYSASGQVIINSVISGQDGEIDFSGSEEFLKALGVSTIQNSSESKNYGAVYDATTGEKVNEVESAGKDFEGLIPPDIDISVDAISGLSALWDEGAQKYMLSGSMAMRAMLTLKEGGTIFQVGANEGEDYRVSLGEMTSYGLGVEGVKVLTREGAARSISMLDVAIRRVSSERVKIGSYESVLEGICENLGAGVRNLLQSEGRLVSADMAKGYAEYVKLGVMLQTGKAVMMQVEGMQRESVSALFA